MSETHNTHKNPNIYSADTTLLHRLERHAEEQPDKVAFSFLERGEISRANTINYGDLLVSIQKRAGWISNSIEEKATLPLLYEPGLDYIVTLLACFWSGRIAVPLYPPGLGKNDGRLHAVLGQLNTKVALCAHKYVEKLSQAFPQVKFLVAGDSNPLQKSLSSAKDLAFLQFTSGSTSVPKGVEIPHNALSLNIQMIARGMQADEEIVSVSWLPLYHDMGLIGTVLTPIYLGSHAVLFSTLSFLKKPSRWFKAISHYQATHSGAPDFAYRFCAEKVKDEELQGLDLSTWKVAFNGAEPIHEDSMKLFSKKFGSAGFCEKAFFPCYGMAETVLYVSGNPVGRGVKTETIAGQSRVSSGVVAKELEIKIVDPEKQQPLPKGQVGEIWLKGPSIARGYWEESQKTKDAFHAHVADVNAAGPFLRTGDLGAIHADELYITGRLKEILIWQGKNLFPQDLEKAIQDQGAYYRRHAGAIFSDDKEKIVVLQEIDSQHLNGKDKATLLKEIKACLSSQFGVELEHIYFLRSGSVPKTSSGKIQRLACKELVKHQDTLGTYEYPFNP